LLLVCGLALQGLVATFPCHHMQTGAATAQGGHAHHHDMEHPGGADTAGLAGDCLQGCDCPPGHCGLAAALLPPTPMLGSEEVRFQALSQRLRPTLLHAHTQSVFRPPILA